VSELLAPRIIERPLPESRARPAEAKISGALVHSMGEHIYFEGALLDAHTALDRQGVSAHCLITPAGEIVSCCGVDRIAYHAGKSQLGAERDLNRTFLGAEFLLAGEHDYTSFLKGIAQPDAYTLAQYQAGGWLYASWGKAFGFGPERIKGHSDVAGDEVRGPGNGKRDPGAGFDWPLFEEWRARWAEQLDELEAEG
jgi:N-acetyl-anhydromuramyl-L-alanine amidase AmpD